MVLKTFPSLSRVTVRTSEWASERARARFPELTGELPWKGFRFYRGGDGESGASIAPLNGWHFLAEKVDGLQYKDVAPFVTVR